MKDFCEQVHLFLTRIAHILQLLICRPLPYRVEVEKYYLKSGDGAMLALHFFTSFQSAQAFAKGYCEPYYRISIHEQLRGSDVLCNIETGARATKSDLETIPFTQDTFRFKDVIGEQTHGWYLNGSNTHNPDFVEVLEDFDFMLDEAKRRLINNSGKKIIHQVIGKIFDERHPKVARYYRSRFEQLFILKTEYEILVHEKNKSTEEKRMK